MNSLEQTIGYTFKNKDLLKEALTHSSYANEHQKSGVKCNERLEFLGDSVLSIIVSEFLFIDCPKVHEGELTRHRAALVCEDSLFRFAKQIGLGEHIMLGKGERNTGGAERASILSDCFEAVLAAIYLDGGMENAKKFVMRFVIDSDEADDTSRDYKTELQEIVQKNPEERLRYIVADEQGPDHSKRFTVEVHLNNNVIGTGTGNSKKRAEQDAAKEALRLMGL